MTGVEPVDGVGSTGSEAHCATSEVKCSLGALSQSYTTPALYRRPFVYVSVLQTYFIVYAFGIRIAAENEPAVNAAVPTVYTTLA